LPVVIAVALQRLLHEPERDRLVAGLRNAALQHLAFLVGPLARAKFISPFSFTYSSSKCQREWRNPDRRLSSWRRMSPANVGPSDSGNRTYMSTRRWTTSGEE
jgi:hypothetical protein